MPLKNLNNVNREFKSLQKSFDHWETGEPSADVWENLEADLAVSAVWDRLDETLEANGSSADKALVDAYENWSPNTSGDGWSRLEEQLSRERVWTRLNTTLSYPVTTRVPWVKMAAASLLFVFLAFYTDHQFRVPDPDNMLYLTVAENGFVPDTSNRYIADATRATDRSNAVSVHKIAKNTNTQQKNRFADNNHGNDLNQAHENPEQNNEKSDRDENELAADQNYAENRSTENPSNTPANEETNRADLASLIPFSAREVTDFGEPGVIGDFEFLPFRSPFRPKFSVLVGGQFSFIDEKDRSAFSSSIPSMGIAGDLQYHSYHKKWRFTQNLGFSQYAQSNGSYVNGRYTNLNQKLNTIHLMSSVGYTFRGVTISGGIAVNRLLNGYEESRIAITNVYNSKKLQVGAAAGVDYHFTPFKNKTALGLGIQYQFVSKLKSQNTVFNDIQGVKLQIKYSF